MQNYNYCIIISQFAPIGVLNSNDFRSTIFEAIRVCVQTAVTLVNPLILYAEKLNKLNTCKMISHSTDTDNSDKPDLKCFI